MSLIAFIFRHDSFSRVFPVAPFPPLIEVVKKCPTHPLNWIKHVATQRLILVQFEALELRPTPPPRISSLFVCLSRFGFRNSLSRSLLPAASSLLSLYISFVQYLEMYLSDSESVHVSSLPSRTLLMTHRQVWVIRYVIGEPHLDKDPIVPLWLSLLAALSRWRSADSISVIKLSLSALYA